MKFSVRSLLTIMSIPMVLVILQTQALADGNRYDLPRQYAADISASAAYMALFHNGMKNDGEDMPAPVMIDVRDINEYSAGHVKDAYSIPFPHIISRPGREGYVGQDPAVFVAAVEAAITDKSTPIFTLCRTGYRSVLAANLLAVAGFTRVMNVWEGFIGNPKLDTSFNPVDVNNNGSIDDGDRDGWSLFAGLPVSTEMEDELLFAPYADSYSR